eukprot:171850-Chlamydomonas_euryale.AAC.6
MPGSAHSCSAASAYGTPRSPISHACPPPGIARSSAVLFTMNFARTRAAAAAPPLPQRASARFRAAALTACRAALTVPFLTPTRRSRRCHLGRLRRQRCHPQRCHCPRRPRRSAAASRRHCTGARPCHGCARCGCWRSTRTGRGTRRGPGAACARLGSRTAPPQSVRRGKPSSRTAHAAYEAMAAAAPTATAAVAAAAAAPDAAAAPATAAAAAAAAAAAPAAAALAAADDSAPTNCA